MSTLAWRLWPKARLVNPWAEFGFGPINYIPGTADFYAHCPHGNRPPSPGCRCGLHFIKDDNRAAFLGSPNVKTAYTRYSRDVVLSVGRPIGSVLPDIHGRRPTCLERTSWGGSPPWRATGFAIAALAIADSYVRPLDPLGGKHLADELSARYGIPVIVARWDERTAQKLIETCWPTGQHNRKETA